MQSVSPKPAVNITRLALLLAMLSGLGPFSIDTYLPAFTQIGRELNANLVQLQITLGAYLLVFSIMNLFHGSISDAVGRRKVILTGLGVFAIASLGAATSQSIEALWFWRGMQGLASGAGMSVGRAMGRDLTEGAQAQRLMGQAMVAFALAPAIAPVIGGWILIWFSWRAIFVFLAVLACVIATVVWFQIPESLAVKDRQPLLLSNLMQGYQEVFGQSAFWQLSLSMCLGMAGFMLYILSAPQFLQQLLGVSAQSFYVLFVPLTVGTMAGGWIASRMAGRLSLVRSVRSGHYLMLAAATVHLICSIGIDRFGLSPLPWSIIALPFYGAGAGIAASPLQVMIIDTVPLRKGMVSSCISFLQTAISAGSAVLLAPLVWGAVWSMAATTLAMALLAFFAFQFHQRRHN